MSSFNLVNALESNADDYYFPLPQKKINVEGRLDPFLTSTEQHAWIKEGDTEVPNPWLGVLCVRKYNILNTHFSSKIVARKV